ncbi:MAG: carbonate dehydratase [Verrucomicrobiaceae bacterium]|nr:MAG: carbonate dehydratase [Verrucomicrobiaceae bacterium]
MSDISEVIQKNRAWAAEMVARDPDFFGRLARQQAPEFLWIGCADSRVPANEIAGMAPGELFVHRNVANVVVHSDLNCLSVMQYAVDVLKVKHIIVTGHYNCGGIIAALRNQSFGLIDNWLRHVQDVYHLHREEIDSLESESRQVARLCELNVLEQVINVCRTTVVQNAWQAGQQLSIHGWIYDVKDGLVHSLIDPISDPGYARDLHLRGVKNVRRGVA